MDTTVQRLPRTFNDTRTIQIKLKRRLQDKNDYIIETVRPATKRQRQRNQKQKTNSQHARKTFERTIYTQHNNRHRK